jgi:hypothetical protein
MTTNRRSGASSHKKSAQASHLKLARRRLASWKILAYSIQRLQQKHLLLILGTQDISSKEQHIDTSDVLQRLAPTLSLQTRPSQPSRLKTLRSDARDHPLPDTRGFPGHSFCIFSVKESLSAPNSTIYDATGTLPTITNNIQSLPYTWPGMDYYCVEGDKQRQCAGW